MRSVIELESRPEHPTHDLAQRCPSIIRVQGH